MRNNLFLNIDPTTEGAHDAMSITVGAKKDLLIDVFGRQEVDCLESDIANNRRAYLNRFGANVHYVCTGGSTDDPIMTFDISGHRRGEALETVERMIKASSGVFIAAR